MIITEFMNTSPNIIFILADSETERVRRLLIDLENWFEKVEFDRDTISDQSF